MARAKVTVGFCVVTNLVRQYGRGKTHDLLGVEFDRYVPADTEFPTTIASLDLFVRFYVIRPGDLDLRLGVWL